MFIVHASECDYSTSSEKSVTTHHRPVPCKHSTLLQSMAYLLFAHSTNTPHTRLTRWAVNTEHIFYLALNERFKGELRCNSGNNEHHHHTRAPHCIGRCAVPTDVSRTKVNSVTAMFVYWHDTAADSTANGDGLDGDGVLAAWYNHISTCRWMANTNVCESLKWVGVWVSSCRIFIASKLKMFFPSTYGQRFCAGRFINICTIDVHLMATADCPKVANPLDTALTIPE